MLVYKMSIISVSNLWFIVS